MDFHFYEYRNENDDWHKYVHIACLFTGTWKSQSMVMAKISKKIIWTSEHAIINNIQSMCIAGGDSISAYFGSITTTIFLQDGQYKQAQNLRADKELLTRSVVWGKHIGQRSWQSCSLGSAYFGIKGGLIWVICNHMEIRCTMHIASSIGVYL